MNGYSSLILARSGLVGYWRLGETVGTSGAGSVIDSGPNGLHGTPTSITFGATGVLVGDTSTAATFGASSKITVPYNAAMKVTTGYSTECWLKPGSMRDYNAGMTRVNVYLPSPFDFYIQSNAAAAAYHAGTGASYSATSGGVYTAGQWQHVVVTWDGATLKQYRNAVLVASVAVTSVDDVYSKPLLFGTREDGATQLIGDMDEASLYSRALTLTEIANGYAAALTALGEVWAPF